MDLECRHIFVRTVCRGSDAERYRRTAPDKALAEPTSKGGAGQALLATAAPHAEAPAAWPGHEEAQARDKYSYRFPGGESYADADLRASRALAWVTRSGARAPLLVSHQMIGRMLSKNLVGLDNTRALRFSHPSDLVYKVHPRLGTFEALVPGGQRAWSVISDPLLQHCPASNAFSSH